MADIYVRSTDGNNADSGATWALAKADIAGAAAIDAAGDTVWLSQNHAESTAGSIAITWAGTLAAPMRIICGNDGAEPPTAVATTATVSTTGGAAITLNGVAYHYGTAFQAGSGASATNIALGSGDGAHLVFDTCVLNCRATVTANRLAIGSAGGVGQENTVVLRNSTLRFDNASQGIALRQATLQMSGGGLHASGAAVTTLFATAPVTGGIATLDGCDLSSGASSMNIVATGAAMAGKIILRNCKLPASWSGSLLGGAPATTAFRAEMWNCDSADTNYRIWIEDYAGSIKHSSAVYKDAFSGGTKHSYVFATSANASYPAIPLVGPEFFADNATTGSNVTATVEVVTDNVTLTDGECWLEVMYLGTSGVPLGAWASDCKADVLATAANQTTSSETWTTTGLTTPVKQKLSVTFTPQEAGYIIGRVVLAKASTTVYVDPELKLT